jgi:hypothetical protein
MLQKGYISSVLDPEPRRVCPIEKGLGLGLGLTCCYDSGEIVFNKFLPLAAL